MSAAAYRRLALFPVAPGHAGAQAVAAAFSPAPSFAGGLLPLDVRAASPTLALNAPLWALVSLATAFALLWGVTFGQMVDPRTVAQPLEVVTVIAARAELAANLLLRTAAAFPNAPSIVLARLRPGDWTIVEVDGRSLRVSDPAQIEAALAGAGLTLEPGDRIVALPSSGEGVAGGDRSQPRSASTRMAVQRAVPFAVVDGGVPFSHRIAASSVGEALRAIGIDVDGADLVQPPVESPLVPGLRVAVLRALPVAITAPDLRLEAKSRAPTVGALLEEQGIALGPLDRVEPSLDGAVPAHGTVRVVRVREDELRESRAVPFQTQIQYDDTLATGTRQRVRAGVAGLVEQVLRVVYEDGVEVQRAALDERIVRQPVDEVVRAGRGPLPTLPLMPVPSVPAAPPAPLAIPGLGPDVPVRRVMTMVATAYDPGPISTGKSPGHPAYGITATGMRATYGVVAVDPRVIPFYTRMYIPGYGFGIAADTGGDIKGNRIDVFYPTYREAIQWGRKTVQVYILE